MRFVLTLNMPNKDGRPTATMHIEHSAESMGEFLDYLNEDSFIVADELYQDKDKNSAVSGQVIVNAAMIGKVKPYVDDYTLFNTR